ncbi:MAG: dihydrofolate reductase, partial [Chloroflexi bacterium]
MRKIVATEYLSLDGVFQEPGEWSRPFWSDQAAKFKLDELFASDVLLLGRTTYQGFASAWPRMERDSAGFADRMNGMPKYVASRTLKKLDWNNSRLIEGDLADAVGRLKEETGKDVLIGGSGDVVNQLLRQ